MKRLSIILMGIVLLAIIPSSGIRAQNNVTFQINMKVKLLEGSFQPLAGDIVTIRGSFNNWGNDPPGNLDTLKDPNADSIYTITLSLDTGSIAYKFWKTTRGGLDWEGDDNREYAVIEGLQTIPAVYFNRDSVTPPSPDFTASAVLQLNARIRVIDANPINPLANPSGYTITGTAITVEAWIFATKLPAQNGKNTLVLRPYYTGQLVEPYQAYELRIDNTGVNDDPRLEFIISDGHVPGNWGIVRDTQKTQTGKWIHAAGTYDGTYVRLYINGNLISQTPYTASIGAGNTGLYIGGLTSDYFNGLIDEVRLWNITRSQAEIQTSMIAKLAGSESGLAGYWQFDSVTTINGISPVAIDLSPYHNDLLMQYGAFILNTAPPDGEPVLGPTFSDLTHEATVGLPFAFQPQVVSWPLPTIRFLGGPSGMSYNADSNIVRWIPSPGQDGYQNAVFYADNAHQTSYGYCRIWVNAVPVEIKNHTNNNVDLIVSNNGSLGNDNSYVGFSFRNISGLFEGDLIVGKGPGQVSGGIYAPYREFAPKTTIREITSYLNGFDRAFETRYTDQRSSNPIGLTIIQRTHSKSTDPDRNYDVLDYEIVNTSGGDLSGLYVGNIEDWDIGTPANDLGGYDASRQLSYVYEATNPSNPYYYGIVALTGVVAGHSIDNQSNIMGNDSLLFGCMTTIKSLQTSPGEDIRGLISVGPYSIARGKSIKVMFALAAGSNLTELQATADAARAIIYQPAPLLVSVNDVPGDQGGKVTLFWNASSMDNMVNNLPQYIIWRAMPGNSQSKLQLLSPATAGSSTRRYRYKALNGTMYMWELAGTLQSHRLAGYSYTAETLNDSTASVNGKHYFLISAQTDDPLVYYDSNVDSGYSVDNLSPISPQEAQLLSISYDSMRISWNSDRTDPDISHFIVYRSGKQGFQCADSNRIKSTKDTLVYDTAVMTGERYYYRITAVDIHGNESAPTDELTAEAVAVQIYDLSASCIGSRSVKLEWTTLSEVNNYGFETQRKADGGKTFETVPNSFVAGHGTTLIEYKYSFIDTAVPSGIWYYRLKQIDLDGSVHYSGKIVVNAVTAVKEKNVLSSYALHQNYPNPFNPATTISFDVPKYSMVRITVLNILGKEVATLIRRELSAGCYKVTFDGSALPSGIYFCRMQSGVFNAVKKIILMK